MVMEIVNKAVNINIDLASDLIKKRDAIRSQIDKLFDLYLAGDIDKAMITSKTNQLKAESDQYEERLKKLNVTDFQHIEVERIRQYMLNMRDKLEDSDDNVKKTIIDAMVEKIIIYPDEVKVLYKLDPLKNGSTGRSELTQGNAGGGEPCLILPYVFTRTEIYEYM